MIRTRIICLATGALLTLAAAAVSPAAPAANQQSLALAYRAIEVTGGVYQLVSQRAFAAAIHAGATQAALARLAAVRKALAAHRAEFDALNAKLAADMAREDSLAELTVMVRFLESPGGRSVERKTQAVFAGAPTAKMPPPDLTPAEWAAVDAFESSPEAKALRARVQAHPTDDIPFAAPLLRIVDREADLANCRDTQACATGAH